MLYSMFEQFWAPCFISALVLTSRLFSMDLIGIRLDSSEHPSRWTWKGLQTGPKTGLPPATFREVPNVDVDMSKLNRGPATHDYPKMKVKWCAVIFRECAHVWHVWQKLQTKKSGFNTFECFLEGCMCDHMGSWHNHFSSAFLCEVFFIMQLTHAAVESQNGTWGWGQTFSVFSWGGHWKTHNAPTLDAPPCWHCIHAIAVKNEVRPVTMWESKANLSLWTQHAIHKCHGAWPLPLLSWKKWCKAAQLDEMCLYLGLTPQPALQIMFLVSVYMFTHVSHIRCHISYIILYHLDTNQCGPLTLHIAS